MTISMQIKPALIGAATGAVATVIAGFTWAGWATRTDAETAANMRADHAVTAALAPVCVEKFRRDGDARTHLTALKETRTWSQGEFVERGGWARVPGTHTPEQISAVAGACAALLVNSG
ncbi:hypothetical protein M8A51_01755 [Schlegelella sp. S2-27]|uniref:Lipoprotein n=1 Tax=Caldimonas mangrovi TaxID=2944811 RepID=A0ABT0YHP4_9BURK|nr:hypothetical protein [Caldimonas mangrovi]MCM5678248.1 hypothetical protein [Caldimonas mangrovi]